MAAPSPRRPGSSRPAPQPAQHPWVRAITQLERIADPEAAEAQVEVVQLDGENRVNAARAETAVEAHAGPGTVPGTGIM